MYWCTADIGWVTGHSYIVYGPLSNRATVVMYEGTPDTPDRDRFWQIVEKYKVTILYTAPTAIRTFMKWGEDIPAKSDLSSLRLIGSVGEPINPEAWIWYRRVIGRDQAPETWVYAIAALAGAMIGTTIGLRWLSQTVTRYVLAAILATAGLQLLFF